MFSSNSVAAAAELTSNCAKKHMYIVGFGSGFKLHLAHSPKFYPGEYTNYLKRLEGLLLILFCLTHFFKHIFVVDSIHQFNLHSQIYNHSGKKLEMRKWKEYYFFFNQNE